MCWSSGGKSMCTSGYPSSLRQVKIQHAPGIRWDEVGVDGWDKACYGIVSVLVTAICLDQALKRIFGVSYGSISRVPMFKYTNGLALNIFTMMVELWELSDISQEGKN